MFNLNFIFQRLIWRMIPTPIPRIPTLIPSIPIIPLTPFPNSPFRLFQVALSRYNFRNLEVHMKIISWKFHIKTPFTFWDMRTWDMWKVCLQTLRNNGICWKLAYFLGNLRTSRANNSRILRIKNAKFSGYCFYMNANI